VHAVAIDPADSALLLAPHEELLELSAEGKLTAAGQVIDLMGFTVVGTDHYLASGHPRPAGRPAAQAWDLRP
jgi:hypothetical protein